MEEDLIIPNSSLTIDHTSEELVITKSITDNTSAPTETTTETKYVDGYLNTITATEYDGSGNITQITVTEKDANGNTTKVRLTEQNGDITVTEYEYDIKDRIIKETVTEQNQNITLTDHNGSRNITQITLTEQNGNITVTDANGNITLTDTNRAQYTCNDQTYLPIITPEGLRNIDNNLAGNYCLAEDIDLSSLGNFEPLGYPNTDITSGSFTGTPFTGTLDGQGHTITGLKIDKPSAFYIGLFAKIGGGGRVKNFTIENPSVKGAYIVGALAGEHSSRNEVANIKVERNDDLPMVEGTSNIGGLVGAAGRSGGRSSEGQIVKQQER